MYIDLFPTPLLVKENVELAKEILPLAEYYIKKYGVPFGMQETYNSTYNNHDILSEQSSDLRLDPLTNYIIENAKEYFNNICIEYNLRDKPFYLFNKVTGGHHPIHAHPYSILSGVFYLKIPDKSAPIIFQDPRDYYKYIHYQPKFGDSREKYKLLPEYVIEPKDGMLLMWPSWLEHQVPFSNITEERIAVAFNLGG